jgi:lanthanide-dependent methanol dehydrogenase
MVSHRTPRLALVTVLLFALRPSPAPCQAARSGAWTLNASAAEWRLAGGDYGQRRFSALTQVTTNTVKRMKPVWAFSTGTLRADGGAPLIANGTLYVKSIFPSIIYAVNIDKPDHPLQWKYVLPVPTGDISPECCWGTSQMLALHSSGRLITVLPNGVLVGLDAERGNEAWRVKLAASDSSWRGGRPVFSGPFVVRDFVIGATSRVGGGVEGCGRVTAWEGSSGKQVWEARCEEGVEGGRAGSFAYDPDLNLLYYAWGTLERHQGGAGSGSWSVGVVARRLETGEQLWSTRVTTQAKANRELAVGGVVLLEAGGHRLLSYIGASGDHATLDRTNGKLLVSPAEFAAPPCPVATGGANPPAASYSPVTGLIYFPKARTCPGVVKPASWPSGGNGTGVDAAASLAAWNPVRGEVAWEVKDQVSSGVLSTATGIVFYGTADGRVKGVDQKTGKVLWSFQTPSGVVGDPVTFGGSDKRQYLAVVTGVGGWGRLGSRPLHSELPIVPASFPPGSAPPGGILLVFAAEGPDEVAATAVDSSDTIPQFPWPPPRMTDRTTLPRGLVVNQTTDTLGKAFDRITAAFNRAGISWSVYAVGTDGFAVVGRQENITDTGSPDDPRWGSDPPPPRGIVGYLKGLFQARPGRYRIVALVVRRQSTTPSPKPPTRQQMDSLVMGGALSLPEWLAAKVIKGRCEALIYEFFRRAEDATPALVTNTRIDAKQHLVRAGLWTPQEVSR